MRIDAHMLQDAYPPTYPVRMPNLGLRGFRGFGDAASLLAEQTSDQTNPFLTPAYYATVAAQNNNECAVNPSSSACQVWQLIQAPTIAQTNENATQLDLANYCEQNVFNHSQFGDPLDTTSCNGSQPVASVVAQAQTQGAAAPSWQTTTPANPASPLSPAMLASMNTGPSACGAGGGVWTGGGCVVNGVPISAPAPVATPQSAQVTQQQINAAASSAPVPAGLVPVGAAAPTSSSTSSTSTTSTSGFTVPAWFTDDSLISGVENWMLLAAGVAALMIVPRLMGGRH